MKKFSVTVFAVLFGLIATFGTSLVATAQEAPKNDPFGGKSFGLFVHFLPGGEGAAEAWKSFDAEKLAEQVAAVGADRLVFTIYQNSGWFNAPNDFYDGVVGWKPGERCSARDIPMELADALAKRNIRFFIYLTGQVPNGDDKAQAAFGLATGRKDQKLDVEFAKKWADVFQVWSVRYGEKVSGWWIDGCYAWCDFNEEIAAIYKKALLTGNPGAQVAFNPGVKQGEWNGSTYSAGEINEPFAEKGAAVVEEANAAGRTPQILTFLGSQWGGRNVRFTPEEWAVWVKESLASGVEVTLDVGPAYLGATDVVGTLSAEQISALQTIRRHLDSPEAVFPKVADKLSRVTLNGTELGGEIDRRIRDLVYKNYMVLDLDRDWLDHFRNRTDRGDLSCVYYGVGKVIDAGSLFAAYTGDPEVAKRTRYLLDEIVKTRDSDGYIGFWTREPNDKQTFINWILHEQEYFTLAAVRNYRTTGNPASLEAAKKMADYIIQTFPKNENGVYYIPSPISIAGVAEAALELYRVSGDPKYLDFGACLQYEPHWFYEPFDEWSKNIPNRGFHLYVMLSHLYPQTELYRLTGDAELMKKSRWMEHALLEKDHGALLITGSSSQGEYFTYNQDGSGSVQESCVTAYLLRFFDSLLRLDGDLRNGDVMERTIYNALFAAQDPNGRQIRYFTCFTGDRSYFNVDTFCCPGNFRRAVAELPQKVYYQMEDGGVAVNLFTASNKKFAIAGQTVEIIQETDYPTGGRVTLRVLTERPLEFSLRFRTPAWAPKMTAQLNGEDPTEIVPADSKLGGYEIRRVWNNGDMVTLDLPLDWRLVRGRAVQSGRVALLRGPVVFCLGKAQNANLLQKFPATRDYILDPATLGPAEPDDSTRPGGVKVTAKIRSNADYSGEPLKAVFTEYPDPSGVGVYFRVPDLNETAPLPLVDDELMRQPRTCPLETVVSALAGPKLEMGEKSGEKSEEKLAALFEPRGTLLADLAADYIRPEGKTDQTAVFPDSSKSGEWSVWQVGNGGRLSTAAEGEKRLLSSGAKVYETPTGFAYGIPTDANSDGLGFLADHDPSPNQGGNWRCHFTRDILDKSIPEAKRGDFLLTHPVADPAQFTVFRWTPKEKIGGPSLLVSGTLAVRVNDNGVAATLLAWRGSEEGRVGSFLSNNAQGTTSGMMTRDFSFLVPVASDGKGETTAVDFVLGNNGQNNSDTTAISLRILAPEEDNSAQADVTDAVRAICGDKISVKMEDPAIFGASDQNRTLKLKIRNIETGAIRYVEVGSGETVNL